MPGFEDEAMPFIVAFFAWDLPKTGPGCDSGGPWSTDPCVQLLPTLAQRYHAYLEAAERMGVEEASVLGARSLHKRMRVFIGICHVTDRL